ncbi:MAG: redox-regulated ATPase YchF [candidate division WOR-3 bacterium]
MKVGIVGLPNVGKSSLFNLLTAGSAKVDLYPFTTIDKNVGVVLVPDERLQRIGEILRPEKLTPAHIEFVDIAGLVKGASAGEGLGNRFLAHIREADMILHIVRNFASTAIPHVFDSVDPDRDVSVVEAELALADLAIVEKRLEHVRKEPKSPEQQQLLGALECVRTALAAECTPELDLAQRQALKGLGLITIKPVVYAVNCSDSMPADPGTFPRTAARTNLLFSAALEAGMATFDEPDKIELRVSLGLAPEGPSGIVTRCFAALDLVRFYTIKGSESRAWAAPRGTTAIEAAAMIHTDLARGFIRADVLAYQDLVMCGDFHACRESGRVKTEGPSYVVQDGDVLLIKFK